MGTTTTAARSWVDELPEDDRVALIDGDRPRRWSFAELAAAVRDAAAILGPERRLVAVAMDRSPEAVIWYLAAQLGRHPVLVVDDAAEDHPIIRRYQPDVVVGATTGWQPETRRVDHGDGDVAIDLHPDLAVLLSTSGSTGSPKLVRLSHDNLRANTDAIVEYLDLGPHDRAITTLPLTYCFGLSILHSHLRVGAGVILTERSVVDPDFESLARQHRPTSLSGVPHTFDLLDRTELLARPWPELRTVTQAGGGLGADAVRDLSLLGRRSGWDLVVMYGQTEATARMAYLPAELATERAGCVGVAIPGGRFEIDAPDGRDDGVGEVVFHGPNVMMGYAEHRRDLALGPGPAVLRTGDLGRLDADGVLELVGRASRIVKPFGLRVDLDRVTALLAEQDTVATVTGDDSGLAIAVHDGSAPDDTARFVAARLGLPAMAVVAAAIDEVPRRDNGKPDLVALRSAVRAAATAATVPAPPPGTRSGSTEPAGDAGPTDPVREALRTILGVDRVEDADTFVSLGGDSLSYVEASIRLQDHLDVLPDDWHQRPVAELAAAAVRHRRNRDGGGEDTATSVRRTRWVAHLEAGALVRAIGIVLVVGHHTGAFDIVGGAHALLAVAGCNAARFHVRGAAPWRRIGRVALPAVVWTSWLALTKPEFDGFHVTLTHGWFGGRGHWAYWFIEALVQLLAATTLLMAIPPVRRLERRAPFAFPLGLTAIALLVRFDVWHFDPVGRPFFRPHLIAWLFLLGWCAGRARTTTQRLLVSVIGVVAIHGFFGNPDRELVAMAGLLTVVWLHHVPVPRAALRPIGAVASASLWIYLTHVQVHPFFDEWSPVGSTVISVLVGVAANLAWESLRRRWAGRRTRPGSARAGRRSGDRRDGSPDGCSPAADGADPSGRRGASAVHAGS